MWLPAALAEVTAAWFEVVTADTQTIAGGGGGVSTHTAEWIERLNLGKPSYTPCNEPVKAVSPPSQRLAQAPFSTLSCSCLHGTMRLQNYYNLKGKVRVLS